MAATRRGVFAEAELVDRVSGDDLATHRLEVAAAIGTHPSSWAARESAAVVLGLELLRAPQLKVVHLVRQVKGKARSVRRNGLDIRECPVPPSHRAVRTGIRTSSAARTAIDLARRYDSLAGVVVLDSAMRRFGLSRADLAAILDDCGGWSDTRQVRAMLDRTDPVAESPFETVSRVELVQRGLTPETQCWLTGPGGEYYRVDFLWWPERTVGEADGLAKYVKYGDGTSRLSPLQIEKLRQETFENWGLTVVRWTWTEMRRDPDGVAERVRRAFGRSAHNQELRRRNREIETFRRLTAAPWDIEPPW